MVWRSRILSLLAGVPIAIVGGNTEGSNLSPGREPLSAEAAANPWPPPQTSLSWSDPAAAGRRAVHLQRLGFNDFHGNLQSPTVSSARPVGGVEALAARAQSLQCGRHAGQP